MAPLVFLPGHRQDALPDDTHDPYSAGGHRVIACHLYDNIELACLYRFPVKLRLRDGIWRRGKAVDTAFNDDRKECLSLKTSHGERLVQLDDITRMEVLVDNPHFMALDFE